jgi:hypothetical protein
MIHGGRRKLIFWIDIADFGGLGLVGGAEEELRLAKGAKPNEHNFHFHRDFMKAKAATGRGRLTCTYMYCTSYLLYATTA